MQQRRSAGRRTAAAGRRRALRGAPGHRIPGRVPLLVGPLARRHQLARRTGHPARRRHPQGVRRQPHPPRRRHLAGPGQRRAHRPPAQPRPASADHRDVARRRTRRPRAPRPSAAARVGRQPPDNDFEARPVPAARRRNGERPDCTALGRHRTFADRPTPVRSVRLPPVSHRGIATVATVEATPREHTIRPSNLAGGAVTSSLQAHFRPVSIGKSPGNQIHHNESCHQRCEAVLHCLPAPDHPLGCLCRRRLSTTGGTPSWHASAP